MSRTPRCIPQGVRPTTGKVKEALFSILYSKLGSMEDLKFLDAFSGTGAIGLEALSRKASSSVFVEKNAQNGLLIRQKLISLGYKNDEKGSIVITGDFLSDKLIKKLEGLLFDIIFADPPYAFDEKTLQNVLVISSKLLKDSGIFVLETQKNIKTEAWTPEITSTVNFLESRVYGDSKLSFWQKL